MMMNKSKTDWAKDTPCKNITIYGYCKYENDGCIFNHGKPLSTSSNTGGAAAGSAEDSAASGGVTVGNTGKSTFNAKTATSFTPSVAIPDFNNIPSFTPERIVSSPAGDGATAFTPSFNPYGSDSFNPSANVSGPGSAVFAAASGNAGASATAAPRSQSVHVGTGGYLPLAGTAFPTVYPPSHSILQYHLYAPDPPPHLQVPLKANERTPETLFIPNNLREHLLKRNLSALQVFPSDGNLPDIVGDYFGLVPLEFHNRQTGKGRYLGHQNSLYKVFSNFDGKVYIIRRIHDVKTTDVGQISLPFRKWQKVSCPNVVKVKDAFTTLAFGDSSLCVVHDYYPQSNSLYETHVANYTVVPVTQKYLWSYLVQLSNALNEVHRHGLSMNNISLDKVIVTGDPGRIKVGDSAVHDILAFDEGRDIAKEQQADYSAVGALLMDLAQRMLGTRDQPLDSMDIDPLFKRVLAYLLSDEKKTIAEFTALFSHKMLDIISSSQTYSEYIEQHLSRELENGRLFRLMCKLNFIFGRMESSMDIHWSEAGDKFPIILFYDYVFHQVDENGKSVMDLTHVLRCLNKLDTGVSEKIILVTPDEMNCIIISYKELKDSIDSTFRSMTQ
ncbi:ACR172Wp [Eremothecium gossypii ATCC 10895]|uniref:PAN2-PAN3 deadenylation complex subunit PAN3 n=1 Tax=Eremothecium gossypii (strain ATCC 10895 / CBS 109.51 / FGSC 9923 / NRRL Y-1056) TaxID=284811 RepID=PAN3_EREGS|nr:ACR172Wp [Eremothecium gossypii ATCC 10895]Q75BU9.1 RecName: Full=PAN2-PAN3 deadenylation complex subunit PAN3; AltName: Full=PAB1P-dependent poly(A)-specific ribonuclease; AltName: Full=Poly(A)-nuclease deadenylation complex subunit 3; Short=PAN deadenylation complex subunit 3 [Eremothecium gossypii ATCC 10895]AAS51398.1 ACR172Wp [Eremothecium gossypii ATCC 10895]